MGDFQNQQAGAEHDDVHNRDSQAVATQWPATAEVQKMIASGVAHPTGVARILHEHPQARNEIMALIHKTLGNGFAQEVAAANMRILRANADGGPGNEAEAPAVNNEELRANADGGNSAASSTPASGGPSKAQTAAMEMDEVDAERKAHGKQSDASTPAPASAAPAGGAHGLSKAQTEANMMEVDEVSRMPLVGNAPTAVASPTEAPVEASKVLKDETVIASSAEVKQPEILRASEVLKDPNQSEEPQKASDVVKDDEAENEGGGGGAKADVGPVKITASVLRVRSSPKISKGNIVGRLTKDAVVEAIGHSGEWVEIKYKGQTAFVHSSFVVGAQDTAVAKAPDQVAPATAT